MTGVRRVLDSWHLPPSKNIGTRSWTDSSPRFCDRSVCVDLFVFVCSEQEEKDKMDHPKLNNGIKNTLRASAGFEAFKGMKIDSASFLDEIEGRTKCPGCLKSRKFFCYTCYIPMPSVADRLPNVKVSRNISFYQYLVHIHRMESL